MVAANGTYEPVKTVLVNEEAAKRAFAGADNDKRYHFNLPSTLKPTDQLLVSFDASNLDTSAADPRYGVEIYFNNVLVQPELVIRMNQLGVSYTTAPFTLAKVNAKTGVGPDNVVSLRGVNYNADGGGNWMGIDYVRIHSAGDTGEAPKFLTSTVSNGKITLTWSGTGALEAAPSVTGPWTAVAGNPVSPFAENVELAQKGRFYRLRK